MFNHLIPNASSYAGQVDGLFWLITVIVGVWFLAAEVMFFWLIFRFRARPSVPSQYVTGKEKHLKRWINIPHTLVLVCDVVIIFAAVRVWVLLKQTLPPPDLIVRVTSQQWAWTFTDPGPDAILDTSDDVRTTDEMHVIVGKTYHYKLESKDVLHSFFVPGVPPEAGRDSRTHPHRLVQADEGGHVRHSVRRDLWARPRRDGR